MNKYKVGIIGATGMVGQRFVTLMEGHPWFDVAVMAASASSAGKSYEMAVANRWAMTTPIPEYAREMVVMDAANVEEIASKVDFVFSATRRGVDKLRTLDEKRTQGAAKTT